MGFSFLMMTITGIVLYIAPPGRVAFWSNWFFVGLSKTQWQSVHTIFSFLFVVSGIFHIVFNWRPLISYLRQKARESLKIRREFVLSTVAVFIIFAGVYADAPPFNYVMEFGEDMTNSWATKETEPPVPHAELLAVYEFAKVVETSTPALLNRLNKSGYRVNDSTETIKDIAARYNISPGSLYGSLKEPGASSSSQSKYVEGSGFGRKLISEVFKENNIIWEDGIAKLTSAGIKVDKDGKIRDIAIDNKVSPIELIKALEID